MVNLPVALVTLRVALVILRVALVIVLVALIIVRMALVIVRMAVVTFWMAVVTFWMVVKQKLNYMHENPVRAGIVCETWHYKYSRAINYCTNLKGKIDLELV